MHEAHPGVNLKNNLYEKLQRSSTESQGTPKPTSGGYFCQFAYQLFSRGYFIVISILYILLLLLLLLLSLAYAKP